MADLHPTESNPRTAKLRQFARVALAVGICLAPARATQTGDAPRTTAEMARFLAMDASVRVEWDSLPAGRVEIEITTPRGVEVRRSAAENATGVDVATSGLPSGVYLARSFRDGVVQHWGFFRK